MKTQISRRSAPRTSLSIINPLARRSEVQAGQLSLARLLLLLLLSTLNIQLSTFGQGTAFTYQGVMFDNGTPANGLYNLRFTLWDDPAAGTEQFNPYPIVGVTVSNGQFTAIMDFGSRVFTGPRYWLQVETATNGAPTFTPLSPRQELTPTPYAIYSESAGAADLANSVAAASVAAPQLSTFNAAGAGQVLAYNGGVLVWTNPAAASGGWSLTGNAGTTPGTDFLGTTDNQPLELWANGARALRLEPDNNFLSAPNVIGGSSANLADPGVSGATIAGGGADYFAVNPLHEVRLRNEASANFGAIGGGLDNWIQAGASNSVISGGFNNTVQTGARDSTIAGGSRNNIWDNSDSSSISGGEQNTVIAGHSFIGGGFTNTISFDTELDVIGGGQNNFMKHAIGSVIGGGQDNIVEGNSATVPGGSQNSAFGDYSLAAGSGAQAMHHGAFVWADSQNNYFSSTANDQFCVRAQGGVQLDPTTSIYCGSQTRQMLNLWGANGGYGIGVQAAREYFRVADTNAGFVWFFGGRHSDNTDDPGNGGFRAMDLTWGLASSGINGGFSEQGGILSVYGTVSSTEQMVASAFNTWSDRNKKENFAPVDPISILDKVSALPITTWNFKGHGERHLGPMAQDFKAAFEVGPEDKYIATVDEEGVALAAIKGLNQKLGESLKAKENEIQQLQRSVAELKELVSQLAQTKSH